MKITQLDYSAIMSANSAKMAAEAAEQNNKALEMGLAINKMNEANFERTRKLQEDAQAIQASANKTNAIVNVINSGLNLANAGAGLYNSIKEAKTKNDLAAYNLANIENVADFQTLIATAESLGSFDENGEFKVSEEITGFLDKVVNDIQTSDWTKEVKEQALMQWAEIGASASISIAQEYGKRQRESQANLETLQLNEIQQAEIIGTTEGYAAGYKFIDGLSYDSTTKELLKLQYKNGVDSGRMQNTALSTLSSNGYNAAIEYIKGLTDITETERRTLLSKVSDQYKLDKEQASAFASNLAAELLNSGMAPADVRSEISKQLGLNDQDPDYQRLIKTAVETEQIKYAKEEAYPEYANLDYLSPYQLDVLKESIQQDSKGIFDGIKTTQMSMVSAIDSKNTAYQTAMDEQTDAFIKSIESKYDADITSSVNFVTLGTYSPDQALQEINSISSSALNVFDIAFGLKDENGKYIMNENGNFTHDDYHRGLRSDFESRLRETTTTALTKISMNKIPKEFEDYVLGSIKDFLSAHFAADYGYLSDEQQNAYDKMKGECMVAIANYCNATPAGSMSLPAWDTFIKNLGTEVTMEAVATYVDLGQTTALVTQTSDYSENRDVLEKVIEYANDEGEKYVIEYANGGYRIPNPEAQKTFDMTTQQLASDLVARDVITAEESQSYVASPARDEDGNLTIAPHIVVGSGDQKRAFEYKGATPCEVIDGNLVPVGFPEHQPTSSTAPADDGFPNGPAGDALREMFYTKADYEAGITKEERDKMDSSQKAMNPYLKRNVTKNSTTAK